MIANISLLCLSSLLILNIVGAKPISSLQNLNKLLEDEAFDLNESEVDGKDLSPEKSDYSAGGTGHPWENAEGDPAMSGKENALARLLNDILSTSKRSWSRFKKGGLRSCFGVRLERIGSFSGLGC
ncbi:natriuretic peptide A-like [Alosa pseudoharengus]|uniref:natriuretic peptide A-like n=1 Tax=Alosa sapidissima TaxID=34773 RepID=UPI001C092A7A|nr:natriuretic peptide A-like [Alosa sapidissima]